MQICKPFSSKELRGDMVWSHVYVSNTFHKQPARWACYSRSLFCRVSLVFLLVVGQYVCLFVSWYARSVICDGDWFICSLTVTPIQELLHTKLNLSCSHKEPEFLGTLADTGVYIYIHTIFFSPRCKTIWTFLPKNSAPWTQLVVPQDESVEVPSMVTSNTYQVGWWSSPICWAVDGDPYAKSWTYQIYANFTFWNIEHWFLS